VSPRVLSDSASLRQRVIIRQPPPPWSSTAGQDQTQAWHPLSEECPCHEEQRTQQESYRIHLNAMLSLPYPTHPEYLLRLHALSVQRDADTLAARLESTYALEQARQLYHSEVDRVEEEYESAKKTIKEKLLEACDERAKKLKEEKDSLELPRRWTVW
jgi:hypothetical protein